MRRWQHPSRSVIYQAAPDTIAAAVNPIQPPALCPPSARVVVVVAQTRDSIIPGTVIPRMLGQKRRIITDHTPPRAGQGHRVNHQDGVDWQDHQSESTRIPHCP